VKELGNIRFGIEKLNNILVCDLFYRVAFGTTISLLEIEANNIYVIIAINHYSKWCETKLVKEHMIDIATKFLEKEIIYRFGVIKYVLTNNGGE
jgi:hypothetical protein